MQPTKFMAALQEEIKADGLRLKKKIELFESMQALYAQAPAKGRGQKTPIAGGSIPDRILGVIGDAGEPLNFSALRDGAKARPRDVREALGGLLDSGRVMTVGNGRTRNNELAKGKG